MKTTNETKGWRIKAKGAEALAKCTEVCMAAARKLKQFEEQFAANLAAEVQAGVPQQLIRQAMNEAEALAWSTRFPLLFLPELAEEKIQNARQWANRQQKILRR